MTKGTFMNRMLATVATAMALLTSGALAHQPVLKLDGTGSTDDPFIIEEPEISKAIFRELDGEPHFYKMTSAEPFAFYAGITKAKVDECPLGKTFSFDVLAAEGELVEKADGEKFEWWPWYEEFGKDWYWVGPEIGKDFKSTTEFTAGTYFIKVYNETNTGQYVLATGDIEHFPLGVIARTVVTMPKIERMFWEEAGCQ